MKSEIGPLTLRKKFAGTWRLVCYEITSPNGKTGYPLGRDAIGILSYDEHGSMSGQLMSRHRPRYASGDMRKGTPVEIASAVRGYLSYFGTYRIDPVEETITHFVEGSLFPNWIGTEQKRHYHFTRTGLILSAPFLLDGQPRNASLTWERVRKP